MGADSRNIEVLHAGVDAALRSDPLDVQIYASTYRGKELGPERSLFLAILEDAIGRNDWQWINRPGYERHGFSFEYVCEHLGFNPAYIRQGLITRASLKPPSLHPSPDLNLNPGF